MRLDPIDPAATDPPFEQLRRQIASRASGGELPAGTRLPTVRALTGGHGVDKAVEAVGIPQTWEQAVRMVRRGGLVNFFGGCASDARITLETALLHYSEITCKASFHHTPKHIQRALEAISNGDIMAEGFINRTEPLSNLLEVMRYLMSHNGHMKTAIVP